MPSIKSLLTFALLGLLLCSCSGSSGDAWTSAVPAETSFIILPAPDARIQSILQSQYMPFLEDISASAVQLIAEIDSTASQSLAVKSILMYPGGNQRLQPLWVTEKQNNFIDNLKTKYARNFTRNEYNFHGVSILSLRVKERDFFAASLNNFLLLSESSNGIENAIRAYRGMQPGAALADIEMTPGSIMMNTPALDEWTSQLARVQYHPKIEDAFQGAAPTLLNISINGEEQNAEFQLSGIIPLTGDSLGTLMHALAHQNGTVTLDEYISSNAAGFGIFHAPPPGKIPASMPDTTDIDNVLINNPSSYNQLAGALGTEFGMVMYAESGFLSTGEYLFLRKLNTPDSFRSQLESLARRNLITKVDGLYFVQSYGLAQLLGSRMCTFKDFYINITGNAAVVSKRKGLAELVASDRSRRRVMSYKTNYEEMKEGFPAKMSGLFIAGSEFNSFLTPYLNTNSYIKALTSLFNYAALTMQVDESGESIALTISTFNREDQDQPFRENWRYDTGGAELSAPPTFGNLSGTGNDEVAFSTRNGSVHVIASDGTIIQQYNTGSDRPIGSPIISDWYGTGQNVVLQAAGNKIYGWNENGELLPQFPFQLSEQITTPLTVTDIDDNRIPDVIVGTADRRLHALNGRGLNLSGWPITTNAPVTSVPFVGYLQNVKTVVAFSSNTVHAWDAAGNPLRDYPRFINANFSGSPVKFQETILGGAVDGNLYATGNQIPFTDSLNVFNASSSSNVKSIYISNSALVGPPDVEDDRIVATAANGSVFLLNENGELQLTKSMGQPSASNWPAHFVDINGDGNDDIVALANYGRLYAWQTSSGERIFDLPTAGMSHLQIGDLDSDGLVELVAQTDNGVQSWTVNR